jgi:hypothetical protein
LELIVKHAFKNYSLYVEMSVCLQYSFLRKYGTGVKLVYKCKALTVILVLSYAGLMIFSRVEEEERSCRYLHISLTPSPPSPEPSQPEAKI